VTGDFTVIAHRGACGYLPENTLESCAAAHAMGANYIEMDVVLTGDHQLAVLHDLYLESVTNVTDRFPSRQHRDGHFYALDFSLEEIQSLRVHERTSPDGSAVFPHRFPAGDAIFRVPSLRDVIALVQGMNQSSSRNTGIYIEPKSPAWHAARGEDIATYLLNELDAHGYRSKEDRAIVQSFDAGSLKRARQELGCKLTLVQLTGENEWAESDTDFNELLTAAGLAEVKSYADGIGPWLPQVARINQATGRPESTRLVESAHLQGLFVHAYTLRPEQLPPEAKGFESFLEFLIQEVGLDGVFTDYPDKALTVRNRV
jgi:glycerophosphoryl diester phosphodiesterase